ncbi:MAG: glycerol-3-phosphate 1-O-acyltransferase PlsY [Proteobacteria bacterium]|nr:glycerol-3-phosphate 1-O-acyltransferase PlsY [Pseudomonadota bacterium]
MIVLKLFALICTYLLCSVLGGDFISKIFGVKDLRTQGSGNIGATNAWRVAGRNMGIVTFLFDALKAFIPVYIISRYLGLGIGQLAMICAVCGHVFPIWRNFKGGRGVATMGASLMACIPALGIIMLCVWLLAFRYRRISSIASISSVVVVWLFSFLFYGSIQIFLAVSIISAIVLWRHRENIERIIEGREQPIK